MGFYTVTTDISHVKQSEQAQRDDLTGLANRRALMAHLPGAIARAERDARAFALLFLDLNDFKQINDCHGHKAGDAVLRGFAEQLSGCVRSNDLVARLGGDEFVVAVEALQPDQRVLGRLVAKLEAALCGPMKISAGIGYSGVSIGATLYLPGCGATAKMLLAEADEAMYAVKHRYHRAAS